MFIQRVIMHHHENPDESMAGVLIVLTPVSIGRRYCEEMAERVNAPGKPDMEKAKEIMLRYGLIPV